MSNKKVVVVGAGSDMFYNKQVLWRVLDYFVITKFGSDIDCNNARSSVKSSYCY